MDATSGAQSPKVITDRQGRKKERKKPDCQNGYKTIVKQKPMTCNLPTQEQNPEMMKETESLEQKKDERKVFDRVN